MILVNRSAIIVKPRQPFLDWVNSVEPEGDQVTLDDLMQEPTIYLLPSCETENQFLAAVRKLSQEIFSQELEGWYNDPETWPRDLSFKVFCQWFEFTHHSMVVDLSNQPLGRKNM